MTAPDTTTDGTFTSRLKTAQGLAAALPRGLLIDGRWVAGVEGRTLDVEDPALACTVTRVAAAGPTDVAAAVAAAQAALATGPWSRMAGRDRMRLLMVWADLIEARRDEAILLETLDAGGVFDTLRTTDIPMAIAALRDAASWAGKIAGDMPMTPPGAEALAFSLREPVGVVGVITPWNAPLLMATKKIAAALAAGCTVVLKPSEMTPLTALWLGARAQEAGLPPGVLNILPGDGACGAALVEHPKVRMISFTGSTRVGRQIMTASAAGNLKRFVLELGGKSPVIVLPDADPRRAAEAIARELSFKTGQYCAAGTRAYVARAVFDEVRDRLSTTLADLRPGHGLDPATGLGPLISARQRDRVAAMVTAAGREGAETLWQGRTADLPGHFYAPVVLGNTRPGMAIHDEEVFGPVLCLNPVADDLSTDDLARLANASRYGLAARIWTGDLATGLRLARLIEAGTVTINGGSGDSTLPFGGFKESGMGRENGREGVLAHTELKTVRLALPQAREGDRG